MLTKKLLRKLHDFALHNLQQNLLNGRNLVREILLSFRIIVCVDPILILNLHLIIISGDIFKFVEETLQLTLSSYIN